MVTVDVFLKDAYKYRLTEEEWVYLINNDYSGVDKVIEFSYTFDNIVVEGSAYYYESQFVIFLYESSEFSKGYGTKALISLKNTLYCVGIKLSVAWVSDDSLYFWLRTYDKGIIHNILYNGFDIKDVIGDRNYGTQYFLLVKNLYEGYNEIKDSDDKLKKWYDVLMKYNIISGYDLDYKI